MKTILTVIIFSFFLHSGCKSSKQSTAKTEQSVVVSESAVPAPVEAPEATGTPNDDGSVNSDEICRLTVSFISIGEGTDPKALEKMQAFIAGWQDQHKTELPFVQIPWGREGEVDYCFSLKEQNPEEQAIFVDEMKSMFKENSLVQISENQKSRVKR